MHNIIYDCDNTIGIKGKDVDDGLTFLYLLGRKDVRIIGVTTTHGNSNIDEVHKNTKKMFNDLELNNIPLFKGCNPEYERQSDASNFLLSKVKENPGDITILATGSLSNLYGAYLRDRNFFNYVKQIVLMGGVLKPLLISGKKVNELNFSCDAEASYNVFKNGKNISIINGHSSLQALFGKKQMEYIKRRKELKIFNFILNGIQDWYELMLKEFNIDGFCNWDAAAAIYITNPELFDKTKVTINPSLEDLKWGYLNPSKHKGIDVYMPEKILNLTEFNNILIKSWESLK